MHYISFMLGLIVGLQISCCLLVLAWLGMFKSAQRFTHRKVREMQIGELKRELDRRELDDEKREN